MFLSPWADRARVCPDLVPFTCHEPGITHQVIPTGRDRPVTLSHSLHVRFSVGGWAEAPQEVPLNLGSSKLLWLL